MVRFLAACALVALLACSQLVATAHAAGDGDPNEADSAVGSAGKSAGGGDSPTPQAPPRQRQPFMKLRQQESWLFESCAVAVLLTFVANLFFGRARNEQLAVAYTTQLVAPGGVLDRNFALLGPGDTEAGEVLLKDSMSSFILWASGRRFCQGFLATFQLVRRQDLLAWTIQTLRGGRDVLELEVRMNEGAMPQLVMAVAPPAVARIMQQDSEDIKTFCKAVEPTRDRIANWPEKLTVLAEHSSIFYDLMTPQLLDLVFGREAFAALRPLFRFLHVTSERPDAAHKQVVRLSFYLPPPGDTATFDKLVTAALLLADLLGSYRLSPEQQKRATEARQRAEAAARAAGGGADARQRRAEERRLAKDKEDAERLKRMTPEQRQKELERRQKLQAKRRMSRAAKKF